MIPARQPIFNVPVTVLALLGLMAALQGLRVLLPDTLDAALLQHLAFVPGRLTFAVDPARVLARLSALDAAGEDGQEALVARFFLGEGSAQPWTVVTYALLHGGWTHLGLNGVWLLAFGSPLARRLGPTRFLVFVVLGAIAGAAAHMAVDPASLQPLVGASASVSACMGAALRFLFRPASEATAGGERTQPFLAARRPLSALLVDRRALAFFLAWFATNLLTGLLAVPAGLSDAPIAWQAHIGGFLFGLLAFPLFDPARPARGDADAPP